MKDRASDKTVQYRTRYDKDVMLMIEQERDRTGKGISEIVNKILKDYYKNN